MFSAAQLETIMRETLPTDAQPGEKVVIFAVDDDGLGVVASFKRQADHAGLTWELQAAARHAWTGEDAAGAKVILRWT